LKNWFSWHTKAHPSRRWASAGWYSTRKAQEKRAGRRLQQVELYQQIYYETKIKPLVDDACVGQGMSRGDRLKTMKRISKEVYEAESDEVKAEIADKLTEIINAAARAADEEGAASGDPESRSPFQLQWYVFGYL
jgi:hypothetical protein